MRLLPSLTLVKFGQHRLHIFAPMMNRAVDRW